ncbi:MAG: hypothetical protein IT324_22370 [Anaerolineae bacterium]|nr:hypothetical protein [Anaerolineae bacterium]
MMKPSMSNVWTHPGTPLLVAALLLGYSLRVAQAAFSPTIYDQQSYEIVVRILGNHGNIFAETPRYNYSPVWAYTLLVLDRIAQGAGTSLNVSVRIFLSGVDLLNAGLIGAIAERVRRGSGYRCLLCYLFNPVAILVVGFDGQFETFAMLPLLLAVWLYTQNRNVNRVWLWLLITTALVIKHIVVFFCWTLCLYLFSLRRAVIAMICSLAIFVLTFVPFLPTGAEGVYFHVLRYQATVGIYGVSTLLPPGWAAAIFFSIMLVFPVLARSRGVTLVNALGGASLLFIVFVYGFSDQYFILPVIWMSVQPSAIYWIYSVIAASTLPVAWNPLTRFSAENALRIIIHINLVWLAATAWLWRKMIHRRLNSA